MPNYQIAQINIGRILAPIDDPLMAEFGGQKPRLSSWKPTGSSARRASMY